MRLTGTWAWIFATGLAACGGSDDGGLFGSGQGGSSASGGSGGDGGSVGGSAGTSNGGTGAGPDGGAAGSGAIGGGPDGGTGGLGGIAGAGAVGGTGGVGGYTLDNVCAQYPQKVCASRAQCCQQTYGFNQAQCEALEKAECDALVIEVKNGIRTFDASKIDVCLAEVAPLLAACVFTGNIEVALYKAVNTCGKIFPGPAAPGTPCTSQTDCAPSSDANGYFGCSSQSDECFQGTILAQGAVCNYYLNLCDDGLDCATPSLSIQQGTCTPITPIGGGCTSSNQCGLGNLCTSSLCQPGKETGTCSNFHHCASLNCDNGQCVPPPPILRQTQCGM